MPREGELPEHVDGRLRLTDFVLLPAAGVNSDGVGHCMLRKAALFAQFDES